MTSFAHKSTLLSVLLLVLLRIPGAVLAPSPTMSSTTTTAAAVQPINGTVATVLPQFSTTTTSTTSQSPKPSPSLDDSTASTQPQPHGISPTLSTTTTTISLLIGETQQPTSSPEPTTSVQQQIHDSSPTISSVPVPSVSSSVSTTTGSVTVAPVPAQTSKQLEASTVSSTLDMSPTLSSAPTTSSTASSTLGLSPTFSSSSTSAPTATTTRAPDAGVESLTTKFLLPSPTVPDTKEYSTTPSPTLSSTVSQADPAMFSTTTAAGTKASPSLPPTTTTTTTSAIAFTVAPVPTQTSKKLEVNATVSSTLGMSPTLSSTSTSTTTTVAPVTGQTSKMLEISSTASSTLELSPTLSTPTTATTTTTQAGVESLTTKFPQPSPTVTDTNHYSTTATSTSGHQWPPSLPASPTLTASSSTTTSAAVESSVTRQPSPTVSQNPSVAPVTKAQSTWTTTTAAPGTVFGQTQSTTTLKTVPNASKTLSTNANTATDSSSSFSSERWTSPTPLTEHTFPVKTSSKLSDPSSAASTTFNPENSTTTRSTWSNNSPTLPVSNTSPDTSGQSTTTRSPNASQLSSSGSSSTTSSHASASSASITGASPLFGPTSGGTRLSVTGSWLNMSTVDAVYIGSIVIVSVDEMSFSRIVVLTPPSTDFGSPQRISVLFRGSALVSTPFYFTYQPNPVIQGLSPTEHIADGGTMLTVAGSSLNSVAQPVLTLTVVGTTPGRRRRAVSQTINNQTCHVVSNESMICAMPPLPQYIISSLQNGGPSLQTDPGSLATVEGLNSSRANVYMGFVLDGYGNYSNISNALPGLKFAFFPAPSLQHQPDVVVFDPETESTIDIKGANMTRGCRIGDYVVTVGGAACINANLFDDRLVCQPPGQSPSPEQPSTSCGERLSVKVKVGFHDYGVYACLEYKQPIGSSHNKLLLLLLLLVVIPLVIIVVIIACCCCRNKTGSRPLKSPRSVDGQHSPPCSCNGADGRDSTMSGPRYYYGEIDGNRTSSVELYPIEEETQSASPDVAYSRVIMGDHTGNGYAENEGCCGTDEIHPAVRRHMQRVSSRALSVQTSARYSLRPSDPDVDDLVDVSVPEVEDNSML